MKRMWILSLILCLCAFAAGSASADEIYAETPLHGADEAQLHNIRLAAQSVDGVWLSIVAAELLALAVTVFFFIRKREQYHYA